MSLAEVRQTKVIMDVGVVRVLEQYLAVEGYRPVPHLVVMKHHPEPQYDGQVVGIECQNSSEGLYGALEVAEVIKADADEVVELGIIGIELEGPSEFFKGLPVVARRKKDNAEVPV